MEKLSKPQFDKRIFWDINFDNLDVDKRANFVIERVFDRGDVEDIRTCRRYYGDIKVTKVLMNAKFLSEHTLQFVSTLFDLPISEFRCYKQRQLTPTLFPY